MKIETSYKKEDFTFKYNVSTRFRDLDPFNHVNNSVFLTYFEDARRFFFERWNINLNDKSLIVASIKIDYIKQITHPSNCIIGQRVSRLGNTSFDILSILFCNDKQASISTTTIVCYDFLKNKSISLYPEIVNDFNK